MSDKENDKDIDQDALAALVRPSGAPRVTAAADDADDDEDVLDLKALAASMAPPATEPLRAAKEPDDEEVAAPTKQSARTKSADAKSADVGTPKKKKSTQKKSAQKSAAKKATGTAAKPATSAREARDSDAPRAAPAPIAQPAPKSNTLLIGIAAAAAVAIVYMMTNKDAEPAGEVASAPPTSVQTAATDEEDEAGSDPFEDMEAVEPGVDDLAEETAVGEETLVAEEAAEESTPAGPAVRMRPRTGPDTRPTMDEEETAAMEVAPSMTTATMTTATMTTATTMDTGALDSVLDMVLGGRPAEGGTETIPNMEAAPTMEAAPSGALPETPSRGDVARSLGRLMPQIRQCAGDQVGLANATILVRSDGTPASVSIGGHPFGGTPQGACMEGVLRGASFPPFSQNTFRVNYPFAIRATN